MVARHQQQNLLLLVKSHRGAVVALGYPAWVILPNLPLLLAAVAALVDLQGVEANLITE